MRTNFPKNFPKRVFSRLVLFQAFLVLFSLAASGIAARYFFKRQFILQVELQLKDTLVGLSHFIPEPPRASWCREAAQGLEIRVTLVALDGRVLCDSHHDSATMDNHLSRPEVQGALAEGFGKTLRYSDTLAQDMVYGAWKPASRDEVIRGAIPLSVLGNALRVLDLSIAVFLLGIALVLTLFGAWASRELVAPMGRLMTQMQELLASPAGQARSREERLAGRGFFDSYGEWSELESSLESIRRSLESKVETLVLERERQAILMESISDAILAVDLNGAMLFFNKRFEILVGRPFGKDALLWELFREPEILETFRLAIREGQPCSELAVPREGVDGKSYFSLVVSPLRKGTGELYGAVGVFHDVTELKRAEQMRIDFVANASHELRTPLTAVKGYADTVAEDQRGGKAIEPGFIEAIRRNADRLMSLVTDLLDLSALESSEAIQKAELGVEDVTERALQQVRPAMAEKRQEAEVLVGTPFVSADARRLEQVLVNLLDNARKYTPVGGKISVAWEASPAGVLLKISDTGPGIPPEHHARLFERFYRVDTARSRELGGTGLGLAIVKHIMLRHGGAVWVESAPGQGATFVCRFPASGI